MACEDGKIVRWCRAQASSRHNTQGVVDDGFNKADVSTAAPDRTAVLVVECTKADVAVRKIVLQHPRWSQQAASRAWRVMSASCSVARGVGDWPMWVTFLTLPEVFGLGAQGQDHIHVIVVVF